MAELATAAREENCCLVCFEADHEFCHRSLITAATQLISWCFVLGAGYVFVRMSRRSECGGLAGESLTRISRAPCKGTVFQWVRIPPGNVRSSR